MLRIATILHPTDFSDRSGYALQLACALARDHGARIVILKVVPQPTVVYGEGIIPPEPDLLIAEAEEHLRNLVVPDANIPIERVSREGDPATEILRLAREINANLIALGTHGRTGLERLLMGSVAEQVMRQATCPVLTVKGPVALSSTVAAPAEVALSTAGTA